MAAAAATVGLGATPAALADTPRSTSDGGPTTVEVTSRNAAAKDAERLKTALVGSTDLQPTGLYLAPGVDLSVEVDVAIDDPNGTPAIVIGAPGTQVDPEADEDASFVERILEPRESELSAGANLISDEHGGVVYLSYPNAVPDTASTATVTFGAAATPIPTFVRGLTSADEFQSQLDQRATPFAELVSEHAIVTVLRDRLLLFRDQDFEELLGVLDHVIEIEREVAGYTRDGGPESVPPAGPHHLAGYPDDIEGVGAYATNGYTAYPPPIQSTLLTVPGLTLDGWGPYHELGHQHQQEPVNPGELVEVSVNIYSLAVQREFERLYGQEPRMRAVDEKTGTSHWDSAMEALEDGVSDFGELGPFEQLAAFEQLRLFGGDEFASSWTTLVRQQDLLGAEDRWQDVVYSTSIASGHDLADFWAEWGVEVDEETRSAIGRLGLPLPVVDPTTLRETNVAGPDAEDGA